MNTTKALSSEPDYDFQSERDPDELQLTFGRYHTTGIFRALYSQTCVHFGTNTMRPISFATGMPLFFSAHRSRVSFDFEYQRRRLQPKQTTRTASSCRELLRFEPLNAESYRIETHLQHYMHNSELVKLGLLFFSLIGTCSSAVADGEKAKMVHYSGEAQFGGGDVSFDAYIQTVPFALLSVQGKYKLIGLSVISHSDRPMRFSKDTDTVTVVFGDTKVAGILDVYRRDSAFWDKLSADMRKTLAYPQIVEAHEDESVFIFIPVSSPSSLPSEIRYKLASLDEEIVIAPMHAKE